MKLFEELKKAKNKWKFIVDNAGAFKRLKVKIVMDNDQTWARFPYDDTVDDTPIVDLRCIGQYHGTIDILEALGIDSEYC